MFGKEHTLKDTVAVKCALTCAMPVENAYYTSKLFAAVCSWCAEDDIVELAELSNMDLGSEGIPHM